MWCSKIPVHWKVMHNKYIIKKVKNIKQKYDGEKILSLTIKGVVVRDLDSGGKMPSSFDGYQILTPGNLLMCLFDYDVTPRCIGIIGNRGVSSPAYSQFRMVGGNSAKFYYYYFLMLDNTKELLHLAKNLRHSFTEEQLGQILSPVPPIPEQEKIANFLDIKCSEIDSLVADIQKEISILEEYRKSVITESVTNGINPNEEMQYCGLDYIGRYPSAWKLIKLKYAFNERNERSLTGSEMLLSVSQHKGVVPSSEIKMKTMQANSLIGYKKVKKDDLVFNKLNPALARFGTSEYDGITSPEFAVYIIDHQIFYTKFLEYILRTDKYSKEYARVTIGVGDGYTRLYTNQLGNIYVVAPPLREQKKILLKIKEKITYIDKIITDKQNQLSILSEYKKSLIYEYVTGKKEVI